VDRRGKRRKEIRALRAGSPGEDHSDLPADVHVGEVVVAVLGDAQPVSGEDQITADVGEPLVEVRMDHDVLAQNEVHRRARAARDLERPGDRSAAEQRHLLEVGSVLAGGPDPDRLQLARHVLRGDVEPRGSGIATGEEVVGQEPDVAGDGHGTDRFGGRRGAVREALAARRRGRRGLRRGRGAGDEEAQREAGGKTHG